MKTVALVGMAGPLENPPLGIDVWGVNLTYRYQAGLTRLYFMDREIGEELHKEIAALSIAVVCAAPCPRVPQARPWPFVERTRQFGLSYWTSTVAYMLTDAIAEGYERIILHRLQEMRKSPEYFAQRPCLDFWTGLAIGRGIEVIKSAGCNIGEPYPWQPGLYGYIRQRNYDIANHTVSAAIRAVMRLPVEFYEVTPPPNGAPAMPAAVCGETKAASIEMRP